MVKYKHSLFISLEKLHKLCFPLTFTEWWSVMRDSRGHLGSSLECAKHSQTKKFLSVLWSFPQSWQRDVGRPVVRPCWSL